MDRTQLIDEINSKLSSLDEELLKTNLKYLQTDQDPTKGVPNEINIINMRGSPPRVVRRFKEPTLRRFLNRLIKVENGEVPPPIVDETIPPTGDEETPVDDSKTQQQRLLQQLREATKNDRIILTDKDGKDVEVTIKDIVVPPPAEATGEPTTETVATIATQNRDKLLKDYSNGKKEVNITLSMPNIDDIATIDNNNPPPGYGWFNVQIQGETANEALYYLSAVKRKQDIAVHNLKTPPGIYYGYDSANPGIGNKDPKIFKIMKDNPPKMWDDGTKKWREMNIPNAIAWPVYPYPYSSPDKEEPYKITSAQKQDIDALKGEMGSPVASDESELRNTTDPSMWGKDEEIENQRTQERQEQERQEQERQEQEQTPSDDETSTPPQVYTQPPEAAKTVEQIKEEAKSSGLATRGLNTGELILVKQQGGDKKKGTPWKTYKYEDIPTDGNCLFNALIKGVLNGKNKQHKKIFTDIGITDFQIGETEKINTNATAIRKLYKEKINEKNAEGVTDPRSSFVIGVMYSIKEIEDIIKKYNTDNPDDVIPSFIEQIFTQMRTTNPELFDVSKQQQLTETINTEPLNTEDFVTNNNETLTLLITEFANIMGENVFETASEDAFRSVSIEGKNYRFPNRVFWGDNLAFYIFTQLLGEEICVYKEMNHVNTTLGTNANDPIGESCKNKLPDFFLSYTPSEDHYNSLILDKSGIQDNSVLTGGARKTRKSRNFRNKNKVSRKYIKGKKKSMAKKATKKNNKPRHKNAKRKTMKARKYKRAHKGGQDINRNAIAFGDERASEIDDDVLNRADKPGVHVLWIRHCHGCHNVRDRAGLPKFNPSREPLCTKTGVAESYVYGTKMAGLLNSYKNNWNLPSSIKELSLHSSTLPRAMETMVLVAKGFQETTDKKNLSIRKNKITRVDHVQEKTNKLEVPGRTKGSWNVTNAKKSQVHAKFLNKNLGGDDVVVIDTENIYGDRYAGRNISPESKVYQSVPDSYEQFKKLVVPEFNKRSPESTLFIIVSHSKYLQKVFGIDHMDNLDSLLVKYTLDDNGIYQHDLINPENPIYRFNKTHKEEIDRVANDEQFQQRTLSPKFKDCSYKYSDVVANVGSASNPGSDSYSDPAKKPGFFQRLGLFGKKAEKVEIDQEGGKRKRKSTRKRHNKKYVSKRKSRRSRK